MNAIWEISSIFFTWQFPGNTRKRKVLVVCSVQRDGGAVRVEGSLSESNPGWQGNSEQLVMLRSKKY